MDVLTPEQRHKNMSRIRGQDTKPEEIVRKYLFSKGFRYRKNDRRYPGKPDIVLPKYRAVIFINGCFWHQHAGCRYASIPKSRQDFWLPKLRGNVERDQQNIDALTKSGWRVIVVWECEIRLKKGRDIALSRLEQQIKGREA